MVSRVPKTALKTGARIAAAGGLLLLGACGGHGALDGGALDGGALNGGQQSRALQTEFTPDSYISVAGQLREGGHYRQALSFYSRAREAAPQDFRVFRGIGLTLAAMQADNSAIRSLNHALRLAPNDVKTRMALSRLLLETGQPEAAREQLDWLIARDPDDPALYNRLGIACDLLGDHLAAQANYSLALAEMPDNIGVRNNLALSFAFNDEFEAAVELLTDMQTIAQSRQNLALVYGLAGDRRKALAVAMDDLNEADAHRNLATYDRLRTLSSREQAAVILLGRPLTRQSAAVEERR